MAEKPVGAIGIEPAT